MFNGLRPLMRIAAELRRIANVCEYWAIADARANNRIYVARKAARNQKDESELLHTQEDVISRLRDEEHALLLQRGYPDVEALDELDEPTERYTPID